MCLPDNLETFLSPNPQVQTLLEREKSSLFKVDPAWSEEASTDFNAALFRVKGAAGFLTHNSPTKDFDSRFKKSVVFDDSRYKRLCEKAAKNLSGPFCSNKYKLIDNQIVNANHSKRQIFKTLNGERQLLSKALMSIAVIDCFRQEEGVDTLVSDIVEIRPLIFGLEGFNKKLLTNNFSKNKKLFNELKAYTGQWDKGRYIRRTGSWFFKDLSKGRCCSLDTVFRILQFFEVKEMEFRKEVSPFQSEFSAHLDLASKYERVSG